MHAIKWYELRRIGMRNFRRVRSGAWFGRIDPGMWRASGHLFHTWTSDGERWRANAVIYLRRRWLSVCVSNGFTSPGEHFALVRLATQKESAEALARLLAWNGPF